MAEYPACDECGGNRSTLYETPDGDAVCIVCYDNRQEGGEGGG